MILPGLAFTKASNSGTDLTSIALFTARINGEIVKRVIGVKSAGVYFTLYSCWSMPYSVPDASTSV